jgi:hypothetical protein
MAHEWNPAEELCGTRCDMERAVNACRNLLLAALVAVTWTQG